ncbi:hypothetical protein B5M09_000877 [Aphanomyces astaci]|uniref:Uncharacterized protein n=1 Tax=Aphanomyces astaci TaxID=112090 RepID=A0A425DFN5_APHAT|nr:hypothetical protein B5M09_000877 [Aphanomyces astaci]
MATDKGASGLSYWTQGVRSLGSLVKDKTTATVRKVSGTTIPVEAEHRSGESFLRTASDIRETVNRGDILTLPNGGTFVVSRNPHDMFTATVVSLKTPRGVNPGVNDNETCTMTSIKRNTPLNMPKVSVPTSMDDVYSAAGSVGKGIVGMVGLGVQAASDLAATAKSYEERVRVYEAPVGTLLQGANKGSRELRLAEVAVHGVLEEVLFGLEQIPDCVVTLAHDSSYAETTSSLVNIPKLDPNTAVIIGGERYRLTQSAISPCRRCDAVENGAMYLSQTPVAVDECVVSLKQGEAVLETSKSLLALVSLDSTVYQISANPLKRLTATSLPLDKANTGPDVAPVGRFVCLVQGSNVLFTDGDLRSQLKKGDEYTLAGVTSSCLTTTSGRTKESVYATPTIVPDCLVSLKQARIKRGDRVVIGGEVYRVSTNHFYRFTADQVPLDSERVGDSVDMDDLQVGDRVADLKDDLQKRDLLTKTQKTTDAIGEKMRPGAEKVAASAGKLKDAAGVAYAKAFGATVLK